MNKMKVSTEIEKGRTKQILKLKNTVIELENSLEGLNSILNQVKESSNS